MKTGVYVQPLSPPSGICLGLPLVARIQSWCVANIALAGFSREELPLLLEPCISDEISDVREAALVALSFPEAWKCHGLQDPQTKYGTVIDKVTSCFQSDSRQQVRAAAALSLSAIILGCDNPALEESLVSIFVSALVTEKSFEVMAAIGRALKDVRNPNR